MPCAVKLYGDMPGVTIKFDVSLCWPLRPYLSHSGFCCVPHSRSKAFRLGVKKSER